jgi:hypothetical protein
LPMATTGFESTFRMDRRPRTVPSNQAGKFMRCQRRWHGSLDSAGFQRAHTGKPLFARVLATHKIAETQYACLNVVPLPLPLRM